MMQQWCGTIRVVLFSHRTHKLLAKFYYKCPRSCSWLDWLWCLKYLYELPTKYWFFMHCIIPAVIPAAYLIETNRPTLNNSPWFLFLILLFDHFNIESWYDGAEHTYQAYNNSYLELNSDYWYWSDIRRPCLQ